MEEIKATDLDLVTLKHVHEMLMKDIRRYLCQREDAKTDKGFIRANAKLRAVCKLDNEIMSLIWKIGDAQQEVHA